MAQESENILRKRYEAGEIEDPKNIETQRIYQLQQTKDTIMLPKRQQAVEVFYTDLLHSIYKKDVLAIGHTYLPRLTHVPTEKNDFPIFDLSGKMLKHLLGHELQPLHQEWDQYGELTQFAQNEFIDPKKVPGGDIKKADMQENGYIYIPHACKKKACDLHVNFHGINSGYILFVTQDWDIIQYAASNDIIVLYPMATLAWFTGEINEVISPTWDPRHTNMAV